ncbi:MAG: PTS sugar transporter subunit IIA [bacterium]|nr:PTS sugar transporter subunit IIA [bacterium]
MELTRLLKENCIVVGLRPGGKREIVEELIDVLVAAGRVADKEALLDATMEREAKGSTGLERGVAVPHCKTDAVRELTCSMGISREGLDFAAADGRPSHVFFFLAAPNGMTGPHVKALAAIARLSRSDDFLRRLRFAPAPADALRVITEEETRAD